ncbi:MAG: GtrA family protein [Caldilineaceae bacterium]|nr:GtrA family protein [Caldilineaceae bacterium]
MTITNMRTMAHENRREIKRFFKFAIVGALGSITDFTILNILIQYFGTSLVGANACSFTAAVIQNFTLNRLWTFPESQERSGRTQLIQFSAVSLIGLAINQVVFLSIHHLLDDWWINLLGSQDLGFTVSYNFAKLVAIGLVLFWNFFANRLWTYRGL